MDTTYLHIGMILSTLGLSPHGFALGLYPKGLKPMEIFVHPYIPMILLISSQCGTLVVYPTVDPGVKENDCSSLPDFSLTYARLGNSRREYTIFTSTNTRFDYIRFPYTWFQYERTGRKWFPKYKPLPLSQMMIFINCANPVNSPLYVETGTCLNGEKSSNVSLLMRSYVNVGGMKASDLMELCSLERMTLLPAKDYKNMSYKEIHSQLAYGFELSWHKSKCGSCATICYIDDSNRTKCAGGQY
jgi:interleukin-1 receptor-associated kinase 1